MNGALDLASDLIGYAGAAVIALTYFLNQHGTLRSDHWLFPALNLGGSLCIVASLIVHPNAPSLLIEAFWSAISLYGLYRSRRMRKPS